MNRLIMTLTGLAILVTALAGSGCAPMPYQGPYYAETEVIIVCDTYPVPYPVPVVIQGSDPLPRRYTPLQKPGNSGNPRIKTPRGDRSGDEPVIARGGDKPASKPRLADNRPSKKPDTRRR